MVKPSLDNRTFYIIGYAAEYQREGPEAVPSCTRNRTYRFLRVCPHKKHSEYIGDFSLVEESQWTKPAFVYLSVGLLGSLAISGVSGSTTGTAANR